VRLLIPHHIIASILTPLQNFNNRLHFPLPPPDTKLAVIRRSLAEYTHLPELSFKLIHAGAVMKDDNAPSCVCVFHSPLLHFRLRFHSLRFYPLSVTRFLFYVPTTFQLASCVVDPSRGTTDPPPSTSIRLFYPSDQITPVIRTLPHIYLPTYPKILPCHILIIAPSSPPDYLYYHSTPKQ
jgi:hypothetical protein